MRAPDGLLTPWHWVTVPTPPADALYRRLREANPAVLAVLQTDGITWEDAIATLVDQGVAEAEVFAGDWLALLPVPIRRYLAGLVPRGGPPRVGLDIETIRADLRDWTGEWPPPQDQFSGYTSRRIRQVLHEAETTWRAEVAAIER